jgi:CBS domain-containing protein
MTIKGKRRTVRSRHHNGHIRQLQEIMTADPVCCVPSDTVQKAARIMREHDTGVVPVVEDDRLRQLVGVVTDRDLCLNVIVEGTESHLMQVKDCMTTKVIAGRPHDPEQEAAALMEQNQIRRLPVVDPQGRLVGIISMGDLVRRGHLNPRTTHATLHRISQPSDHASEPRAETERALALQVQDGGEA